MAGAAAVLLTCFAALAPDTIDAGSQCGRGLAKGPWVRVAVSPDDNFAAVAGDFSGLHVYNVATGAALAMPSYSDTCDVAFSPDAKNVVVALESAGVAIIKLGSGMELWSDSSKEICSSVAYSPDGTLVASGHKDGVTHIWNAETGALVLSLTGGHTDAVLGLAYTLDGGRLISASADHTVVVWDATTGDVLKTLTDHTSSVYATDVSPGGLYFASVGAFADTVIIYKLSDYAIYKRIAVRILPRGLAFSRDGSKLLVVGDGDTGVYSVETGVLLQSYTMPASSTWAVAHFHTSDTIITGDVESSNARILLWDDMVAIPPPAPGSPLTACPSGWSPHCMGELARGPEYASSVAVSQDDNVAAVTGLWSGLHVYNVTTGTSLTVPSYNDTRDVAFSPDAKNVVVALEAAGVAVVTLGSGTELWSDSSKEICSSVAYSPDGTLVASGHKDGIIHIWNAETGALVLSLTGGHTNAVLGLAYTLDGGRLISGSWDQKVVVWDATTGNVLKTLTDHVSYVYATRVSPDGLYFASAGGSYVDAVTIYKLSDYSIHKKIWTAAPTDAISFSRDWSKLVLMGMTSTQVYSVDTGRILQSYATGEGAMSRRASHFHTSDTLIMAQRLSNARITLWDDVAPIPPPALVAGPSLSS